jgi:hypothetical protein
VARIVLTFELMPTLRTRLNRSASSYHLHHTRSADPKERESEKVARLQLYLKNFIVYSTVPTAWPSIL